VRNSDFPLDDCLITQHKSAGFVAERNDIPGNATVHPQSPAEVYIAVDMGSDSN
jgi:hypothetical protein